MVVITLLIWNNLADEGNKQGFHKSPRGTVPGPAIPVQQHLACHHPKEISMGKKSHWSWFFKHQKLISVYFPMITSISLQLIVSLNGYAKLIEKATLAQDSLF